MIFKLMHGSAGSICSGIMLLSSFHAWKYCVLFVQQYLQGNSPHLHSSIQLVQEYPICSSSQKLKGCSSSLLAWSIKWIPLFGEIPISSATDLFVLRRRRDIPSSICQLKRILQHKATLMEEELLHNNAVIIGPSEPMQNDQTCFFSNIFLKFYNIIKII